MGILLKIDSVSKHFGGLQAVKDVSLSIEEGTIVGLIGPNGAGKTTVFNLITGFCEADRGCITFKDEEITGLSTHCICQKGIARTFQIAKPFEGLSVLDTVIIGALVRTNTVKQAEARAEEILHHLNLEDKRKKLGRSLTVIERKRLELARALASKPKLLLIDEVIAGLNPIEVDEISGVIRDLVRSGITVFMIEHVMRAILALAERVVVLDAGAKIAEGDPKNLLRDPIIIEAYMGRDDG